MATRGTVHWFSDDKGYGFLLDPDGRHVYVHYTSIEGEGFTTLPDGAEVEFVVADTPRGPEAVHVRRLG